MITRRRALLALLLSVVLVGGVTAGTILVGRVGRLAAVPAGVSRTTPPSTPAPAATASAPPAGAVVPAPPPGQAVYLHYYLWWTQQHWKDKLGPAYPYSASPPPMPGATDTTGCNPKASFDGSQLTDLPVEGLYDQNQSATYARHVDLAWRAGVRGFLVSWQGTGSATQQPDSSGYDSRLDLLVEAVDAYNAAHHTAFGLGLAFASYGDYNRPAADVTGDLTYFLRRYGRDPAFGNPYSSQPMVMWLDSRKYALATVAAVSSAVRPGLYLLGDETYQSWSRDSDLLDGTSYYWSTENPSTNVQAASSILKLGAAVKTAGKRWFAPFIAGYNKQLLGGTCVPRRGTDTLQNVWRTNAASHPDAWFGISWNEFVEGTYLEPSRAYGTRYLDALATLIRS